VYKPALPLLVACLALTRVATLSAQEDKARAVIEKAVAALGGSEKLAKRKSVRITMKGSGTIQPAVSVPVTHDILLQPPGQLKTAYRFEFKDKKFTIIQVVDGERAWRSDNGRTREAKGHMLTHMREGLYAFEVETLLPLLGDKSYRLSPLREVGVNGRPAAGVKVAREGHKDVRLYFDKGDGLLVKSERRSPEFDGKDVLRENYYSNYKPAGGRKHWMKVVVRQDGKKLLEGAVTEIKFVDRIDDGEVAKP
jgi:hypothetical protein